MSTTIPTIVYILCFATSAGCSWLLVRSYRRTRTALLMWTAICFVLLSVTNFILVVDLVLLPEDIDLRYLRYTAYIAALATLLYGFIWELD